MKLFLFGATGGTGREVLNQLLRKKFQVMALVRRPEAITISDANLKVIKGNVYNPETYRDALSQCDGVISVLGTGTSRKPTTVYSAGGQHILSVMRNTGKKRLITVTAGACDPADPATNSFLVKYIVRPLFKNIYSDMRKWETILENSPDIEWTVIRPARLTNGPAKGSYRVQAGYSPKGGSKISRSDLAKFIVEQIGSANYIHQKVIIAY